MLRHRLDSRQRRFAVEAGKLASAADQQTAMRRLLDRQADAQPMLPIRRVQLFRVILGNQVAGTKQNMIQHWRQGFGNQDLAAPRFDRQIDAKGRQQRRRPDAGRIDHIIGAQFALVGLHAANPAVFH